MVLSGMYGTKFNTREYERKNVSNFNALCLQQMGRASSSLHPALAVEA